MKNKANPFLMLIAVFGITLFSCGDPTTPGGGGGTDTVADVKKEFCGVPPDMLVQLIRNYKTEVWTKTSDPRAGKYDARFMEISIEQLENFLAYAKQSAKKDSLKVTSIRMYYINYPGEKKNEEYLLSHPTDNVFDKYSGCHSIALVPVVGTSIRDAARRDYYSVGHAPSAALTMTDFTASANLVFMPDNCGASSPMENHNEICPPMRGCMMGTLLEAADTEAATE